MKNLFKKSAKKETKATIQKIDKKQLEKVVGGTETTTPTTKIINVGNTIVDDLNGLIR